MIKLDNKNNRYELRKKSITLKKLFEEFYIIPKEFPFSAEQRELLEKNSMKLLEENVASGKDGYIVYRGKKPKSLTDEQIAEIKADDSATQRDLAKKYHVSASTINKIKNNKY